ncbi:MAG: hypothetical protein WDN03_17460 [Rhizomicrobium sp.]
MRFVSFAVLAFTACAVPAAAATLPDGTYTCKSSFGTSMTTPGYVEIRGGTYRFHESGKPDDQPFAPYALSGGTIVWHGPMGFMTAPGFSMGPTRLQAGSEDDFYFDLNTGSHVTPVNCGR